jgi:hypothetical protein
MEMIKLVNGKGDIIERKKIDYTPNIKIWELRGWKPYVEPKPEPKIDNEWKKEESIIDVDSFNNKSAKHKKSKKKGK